MSFIDIENIDLIYRNSDGDEIGDGTLALSERVAEERWNGVDGR